METALVLHKAVGIILLCISSLLAIEIIGNIILLEQVLLEVPAVLFPFVGRSALIGLHIELAVVLIRTMLNDKLVKLL